MVCFETKSLKLIRIKKFFDKMCVKKLTLANCAFSSI